MRAASIAPSMSLFVWAAETNNASNWLHNQQPRGRKTRLADADIRFHPHPRSSNVAIASPIVKIRPFLRQRPARIRPLGEKLLNTKRDHVYLNTLPFPCLMRPRNAPCLPVFLVRYSPKYRQSRTRKPDEKVIDRVAKSPLLRVTVAPRTTTAVSRRDLRKPPHLPFAATQPCSPQGMPRLPRGMYAGGIFLCPTAALLSGAKGRFAPDISKRLRFNGLGADAEYVWLTTETVHLV